MSRCQRVVACRVTVESFDSQLSGGARTRRSSRMSSSLLPRKPVGIGTWHMGESRDRAADEVASIRAALDHGLSLIDTAEMYGDGGAERIVGEAIVGRRADCQLISKVLPHNASRRGTVAACEASLKRLGVEQIDLYLLHWPGSHPLEDTVAAFEQLREQGKIGAWGVSNFDLEDMQALTRIAGAGTCVANQVWYSLGERGIEYALKPWHDQNGVVTIAYCPLDEGRLPGSQALAGIARPLGITTAQLAIAWLISRGRVWPIPMTRSVAHAAQNAAAAEITLDSRTRSALDRLFPPPGTRRPLGIV